VAVSFFCNIRLRFYVINILIISSLLSACTSPTRAPISSREQPPTTKVERHVVAPGETLYSIAWRYGLDYKGLAKANGIGAEFRIFPGQIIDLRDRGAILGLKNPLPSSSPIPVPQKPVTQSRPQMGSSSTPYKIPATALPQSNQPRSEKKSSTSPKNNLHLNANSEISWRWPARGRVVTNFYAKKGLKRGIDIEGKKGESVIAAASGEVVFAGSGLRGYGNLVIIKHNEKYLSAYAYNHRLRVKEGELVKAGQRIADIGSTGIGANGETKLHFQIRRSGKPIDPMKVLPRR
jgi:lipoprotein NlpD